MSYERLIKYSVLALIVCIAAYFCYSLITGYYQKKIEEAKSREAEALQGQNEALKGALENLEGELNALRGQKSPVDRIEKVFGNRASQLSLQERNLTFEEIEELVMSFFSYLDKKGYVERNKLTGSTYSQYETIENDLSVTIPVVSGETENLYNLLQNSTHFYRILGKQRLSLVKDILTEESDILEFAMKVFYVWYTYENENQKRMKRQPSPDVLYEYAGYFLNSLGGKSYLLRRDSKIRILTGFYSILILDTANDRNMNSNGLDIRPFIRTTFDEISNHAGLFDKSEYLILLEKLKLKYGI